MPYYISRIVSSPFEAVVADVTACLKEHINIVSSAAEPTSSSGRSVADPQ